MALKKYGKIIWFRVADSAEEFELRSLHQQIVESRKKDRLRQIVKDTAQNAQEVQPDIQDAKPTDIEATKPVEAAEPKNTTSDTEDLKNWGNQDLKNWNDEELTKAMGFGGAGFPGF